MLYENRSFHVVLIRREKSEEHCFRL